MTQLSGRRGFGSDNHSGVHPKILAALTEANVGHVPSYGTDPLSEAATARFRELCGDCSVYFVFNGTAANVLSVRALTHSHHAVICAESAHLNVDECGAPEFFTGCKLLTVPTAHGKLSPADIERYLVRLGDQHVAQPRVVSITQPTEFGTVYSIDELRALSEFVHARGLLLHIDGARLVNAAASLNVSLKELTSGIGADVVSFGGTKNGLMFGEAVLIFNKQARQDFAFVRKQAMQLPSKSRFIAAQFLAFFDNDLWLKNAKHANAMAARLREGVSSNPRVEVTHPVQANAVFAKIPADLRKRVVDEFFFYVWDEHTGEVRWMCTWDTTTEDIERFVGLLGE